MSTGYREFLGKKLDITRGPDKFELCVEHFLMSEDERGPIGFSVGKLLHEHGWSLLLVHISKLEREDGSAHCWNFSGRTDVDSGFPNANVHGFYSTKPNPDRDVKGWIEITL